MKLVSLTLPSFLRELLDAASHNETNGNNGKFINEVLKWFVSKFDCNVDGEEKETIGFSFTTTDEMHAWLKKHAGFLENSASALVGQLFSRILHLLVYQRRKTGQILTSVP